MSAIRDHWVKTRKTHLCHGCLRKLPAGSDAHLVVWADEGELQNVYWCPVCTEYWDRYCSMVDSVMEGELRDQDPERWEELRKEVEVE